MAIITAEQRYHIMQAKEFAKLMTDKTDGLKVKPIGSGFANTFRSTLDTLLMGIPFTACNINNKDHNDLMLQDVNDMDINTLTHCCNYITSAIPSVISTDKKEYLEIKNMAVEILEEIQQIIAPLREESIKAVFLQLSAKGSIIKPHN